MTILYPYSEILPKKKAHDVFIFQECSCLSEQGASVTLLCGKGSKSDAELFQYYDTKTPFQIKRLPLVRKNNPLNLSWNLPFFFFSQIEIEKNKPDAVIASTLKQGYYNFTRRVAGVRYLYEVHELSAYPGMDYDPRKVELEKSVFEKADVVVVTTEALEEILKNPPYSVKTRIEVIPLGVSAKRLPEPTVEGPITLYYVGQLYEGQGVKLLLESLQHVENVALKVVGGREEEIKSLQSIAQPLKVRVDFLGFQTPAHLPKFLQGAHAFVAPFLPQERMPYVAHTKLYEYVAWGRPVIAPDLPATKEHFPGGKGVLFFEAGNAKSLGQAIERLKRERESLQKEIPDHFEFTWEKRGKRYLEIL